MISTPAGSSRRFRCSKCGGRGEIQISKTKRMGLVRCVKCDALIPAARLEAVPDTTLCVNCAENDPSGRHDRRVAEPWGSRADYKRDRSSWKRTH
jgi:RNA polymerase-binding transcription factor DksA